MIVLDTDVISEALRARPDEAVASWLSSQPATSLFLTTITRAELGYGVALLPEGQRRRNLEGAIHQIVTEVFQGRVLPFDGPAADTYAVIAASRRAQGRSIGTLDAQIAAITRCRGGSVATRNVEDFAGCGIPVLDPWRSR